MLRARLENELRIRDYAIDRINNSCVNTNLPYIKILINRYQVPISKLITCCETAALHGCADILKYFYELGVPMAYSVNGSLALLATNDHSDIFKSLSRVNEISTEDANSCLLVACRHNSCAIAAYILERYSVSTAIMLSAFDIAVTNESTACLGILCKEGAVPLSVDADVVNSHVDELEVSSLYQYLATCAY